MQEIGLAKSLEKKGLKIDIFLLVNNKELKEDKIEYISEKVRIIYLKANNISNHGLISPKFILKYKLDGVHLLADNQLLAPRFIKFCKKNSIPIYCYIGTIQSDSDNSIKKSIMNIIEKRNVKYYKKVKVIAKTEAVKKTLESYGVNNVKVIPVGLDLTIIPKIQMSNDEIKEKFNLPKNKKILMFVGRLEKYKEPLKLIDIFNFILRMDANYNLIIVGDGSLKEAVLEKISEYKIEKNITMINKIDNNKIHQLYKCSDAYLNMNSKEIFGMSILEAMNGGCPVIARSAPGPLDIITDKVDGEIIDDYDFEKWYCAVKKVTEKEEFKENAKNKINSIFNWDSISDNFMEVIKELKVIKSEKQNILLIHNYYKIHGGEDVVVRNEMNMLKENGHNIILYTRNNQEIDNLSFVGKIKLSLETIYSIKTYKEVKRIIEENNIDIVHVHNTFPLISPSVYHAAKKCNIKIVQTIHNFRLMCPKATLQRENDICEECLNKGLHCSIKYKCYRDSKIQTTVAVLMLKVNRLFKSYSIVDNYIALTNFNKEKLSLVIDKDKIKVKPNFIDNVKYKTVDVSDRKYFSFIGRLDKTKGIRELVEAWKDIDNEKLLIVGTGDEEKWVKDYIKKNNLYNVDFIGFKEKDDVMKILSKSKALILPSKYYEGFPMTIIEALSLGVPILSSNVGNLGTIITENNCGETFDYRNKKELVEKVENFKIDKQIEFSKQALNAYENKYNKQINYNMLLNIYNS